MAAAACLMLLWTFINFPSNLNYFTFFAWVIAIDALPHVCPERSILVTAYVNHFYAMRNRYTVQAACPHLNPPLL